jgi:hypothetical protein
MKKLLALILITLSASAMAGHPGQERQLPRAQGFGHHPHGHWARGYGGGWGWAVPAVIGGLLVYEAARQPVIVQQAPVIVQQPPLFLEQASPNCTAWVEVQSSDGSISRTRTCTQ